MKKERLLGCLAVFASLGLTACKEVKTVEKQVESEPSNEVVDAVARVGEVWLLEEDLAVYRERRPGLSREKALQELIQEEAIAQAAVREKLDQDAETKASWRATLASRFLSQAEATAQPNEEQLRESWATQKERWKIPAQARVAAIRRRFTGTEVESVRESLSLAAREFRELPKDENRKGFGALAARFSDEPNTRYQGGTLGWVSSDSEHLLLPPQVTEAIFAEPEAGLLEPVVGEGEGWLILIEELKAESEHSFDEVRDQLEREWISFNAQLTKEQQIEAAVKQVTIEMLGNFASPEREEKAAPVVPALPN
ncbi:peptidylprolyl isomerase [Roseibacillus persicicus]|uniref:peptidylprolyl isomerase n=1 Tax=Roseibacillus persicicus TaxID=454148 RepID=UPI00398A90E8